jgi:ABC-type Fe3+-hydroxamate transport system substrate-binding protein
VEPADVVARVPSIGGTKNPRVDDVCDLSPDLVIANQEENTRSDLEKLAQRGIRVYVGFPKRVADGLGHMAKLARVFGVGGDTRVRELCKRGYEGLREAESSRAPRVRVFCPIWLDGQGDPDQPSWLMTANGETFVSDVIAMCGGENVFAERRRRYPLAADMRGAPAVDPAGRDTRYPRVAWEEVLVRAPELVLLPDEPFAFDETHVPLFRDRLFREREGRVARTDGKDVTWYGAWSVDAIARLRKTIAV